MMPKLLLTIFLCILCFVFLISCHKGYKKEKDHVYYESWNENSGQLRREINADPNTFEILEYGKYAKDKQHVFYEGNIIESADPKTFEPIEPFYAKDKNTVWMLMDSIVGADPKTFEMLPNSKKYARDINHIYFDQNKIVNVDPKTFTVVDETNNVSRDKEHYYFQNYLIKVKDYATFTQIKGLFWKDKYYVYYVLNAFDNKDPILEGVDPNTVKAVPGKISLLKDKFGCHDGYERVNCN